MLPSMFSSGHRPRSTRLVENKRLKRKEVLEYFVNFTPTTVAMEACVSAHYWRGTRESGTHGTAVASSDSKAVRAGQRY